MFLVRRQDEIKVQGQRARPAERTQRRPRRDVALDGADGLEHVETLRCVFLLEVRQKVPTGQEVSGGREHVGNRQQRDDLLRSVPYVLEEEVGEEDEKRAEHGERAADDGAIRGYTADIETHQTRRIGMGGTVVRSWTSIPK